MMTLAEVRDWLKTRIDCPQWYIGKIDGSKQQCIGLYNTTGAPVHLAVGGIEATGYRVKAVSILIHWGRTQTRRSRRHRRFTLHCSAENRDRRQASDHV
ncbi:hypothetical protein [Paenibacillus thiaminolyticus]|uniref:hypothetical protein n=1 Tax=Paenibacillus thiaminolyticus TaxID=49283 RepID=UPI001F0FCF95|nr:hypothetical protein [Paenibacillus thiaminolyticus]